MNSKELKNNAFFKFPKALIYEDRFKDLSDKAKLLYVLFRDRLDLSVSENWRNPGSFEDSDGVYIIYTHEEIRKTLGYSTRTITRIKRELISFGLIKVNKQFNGADKVHIFSLYEEAPKVNHEGAKSKLREAPKVKTSKTDISNTDISKTERTRQSFSKSSIKENIGVEKDKELSSPPPSSPEIPKLNVLEFIQNKLGRQLSPFEIEDIGYQIESQGDELVLKAWQIAAENRKLNLKYVKAILRNWKNDGIVDLSQVEAREEKRQEPTSNIPGWSTEHPDNKEKEKEVKWDFDDIEVEDYRDVFRK